MGAAIRDHDWSATTIGAMETWPSALRNALNLVLNSRESMFVMWGPDLTFFFNDAYRPLLGPRLPMALGSNISVVWADTWDQVVPVVDRALAGEGTRFENVPLTMARYGETEQTWWTFSFSPLYDDSGAIPGMLGITRETTNQVLANQRVRSDHAALTQMFEQAPSFIAILRGPDHRVELANTAYMKLIGHRPLLGRTVAEALPDAAAQGYVDLLDHVYRSGEAFSAAGSKYAVQAVAGGPFDERYVDFVFQPTTGPDGTVTGIFVEGYDVTERVAADERLRRLNESLEAEVHARTAERDRAWRLSPDLFVVVDADGAVKAQNPAWTHLLGWDEAALTGIDFASLAHPDDAAMLRLGLAGILAPSATGHSEHRLRHRDGTYRWFAWTGALEEGLVYASGRDVTAQREQAAALALAEEALRQSQKLEAVGQLTGGVAHDFNNLLTIIRSSVDFLRRPDLADERRRRYMDAVSDTVDRAAKLTGQLLAFARRQALKPEVFEVGQRLRAVADMLDTVTGTRVRVIVEIPDAPCFVHADVSQFETALINMAVNARDAMDGAGLLTLRLRAGGRLPQIRGHAGSQGAFAAVSLTDTGSGIAPDALARIFEPFFTTKEVGRGTGLGLSQVFGFAKQSGGDVAVESCPGQGSTFTLYLPEVAGQASREGESEADAEVMVTGAGQHILVVEDNLEVGRFATQILEDLGYRTDWAVNAEEALAKLGDDGAGYDAVFSDVVMPGMGGIALAKLLRRRLPDLPVILASGYSTVLAQEGVRDFELLQKPYSADQLARILRRLAPRRTRPLAP